MVQGNGFSYHLGIKRDIVAAIQVLNEAHAAPIDTGSANDHFFVNIAGPGLDATVAYKTKLNTKGDLSLLHQYIKRKYGI
ncbi:MAG: hypothetical protein IPN46_06725 [Saprospiraceae bacterium]|nr:hypothetical protein [Saprospiraceae bacterium]